MPRLSVTRIHDLSFLVPQVAAKYKIAEIFYGAGTLKQEGLTAKGLPQETGLSPPRQARRGLRDLIGQPTPVELRAAGSLER